ncbi:MAG: ABC transporter permease [Butyricicoccus pullicaecorum]|nr:ABC transporter permease [Butyricicoccus pullicaecorum]
MDKQIILNRMRRNPFFIIGSISALLVLILTIFGPMVLQFDPTANSLTEIFVSPEGFSKGLQGHILGTDQMGRDVLMRLLVGGRYSLSIAFIVVFLEVVIGMLLGLAAGYFGGWLDAIIMRACDAFLAIPNLILAIAVMAVMGKSITNLILVLAFAGWVRACKLTRNNVSVIKKQEFVQASKVLGAGHMHIIFKQIFPNVTTHIIILASQRIGQIIIVEAALSFLQLGIQAPTPSWGNMISVGRDFMTTQPWMVFAPGIALMIAATAFNFLGDGLRDVLDPKRTAT